MAFSLPLPPPWKERGWKLKIFDKERIEPPHASLLHRSKKWRWNLRTGGFMDTDPAPSEVPKEVVEFIRQQEAVLRREWDRMYPSNPIGPETHDD